MFMSGYCCPIDVADAEQKLIGLSVILKTMLNGVVFVINSEHTSSHWYYPRKSPFE